MDKKYVTELKMGYNMEKYKHVINSMIITCEFENMCKDKIKKIKFYEFILTNIIQHNFLITH